MPSVIERILMRCVRNIATGCLEWQGGKAYNGYGLIKVSRKMMRTHRLIYEYHYGPIPEGMKVLHTCDNPPCCEPAHLFLGTDLTNALDRKAKGRGAYGQRQGLAKLTETLVADIRLQASKGVSTYSLAKALGLHPSTVRSVIKRETWQHVSERSSHADA